MLPGAPTIYQSLLDGARTAPTHDLSSLRLAVTGAAVVPVVLVERMRAAARGWASTRCVTAFGMTEAVVATMCRRGDSAETVATTCGRAVPGMETRIADPARPGRGRAAAARRLRDARLPRRPGGHRRGDRRRRLAAHRRRRHASTSDGNLTITDRLKDMYISGGFNVYPAEVEQALARLDGVADVAVVGVPDERLGEVGKAYVVRRPARRSTADDVIAFARERLANFKVPREVEFVDALPRNLAGKVLKTELREEPLMDLDLSESELRLPGRGARVAGGQRAGRAAAVDGHRRGLRAPTRSGRRKLAEARWSVVSLAARSTAAASASLVEWVIFEEEYYRAGAPGRVSQNGIFLLAPIHLRARHPGAAGPVPAVDGDRRADLGAGLVRARGRLRPGLAALDAPRRDDDARRLGAQRAEDLVARGRRTRTGASACSARPGGRSGTTG